MTYKGKARTVGDHIDTDAIIPAHLLVSSDPAVLGPKCMSGLDPDWAAKGEPGDVLVAGRNFGCGSSREHAPIAILGAGIRVVIAHSFARIFYRNAFNTGLLLIEAGDDAATISDGDVLEIVPDQGVVRNLTKGTSFTYPPLPPHMAAILGAGGLVPYVRERLAAAGGAS
ncbi:MAG: 3-isopropylmalate dehydratase small subunit [Desulfovibrio sp.]|jgi:3-isopropylmalate/(R)-2-methylmalate dehydratase small subunit|nr:3-isopropylmalate dehydratase small subunit [Desulfovibrio sp.]